MNAYYHYKYKLGLQFVSTAPVDMIRAWFKLDYQNCGLNIKEEYYPRLLGVWRFKKLTNKKK
jgi:hypothetical protein